MQKILIVIDMQNDFVTGSLGSEAAQVAAKNIAAHINEYDTVIFTRDTHGPDYLDTLEGKFLPVPHCIKDTEGWEIIPELVNGVSKVKNLYVVDKDTFGTFIWGSMSVNMSVDEDTTIEICGVCTDICVVSNALIMRAFRPNQKILNGQKLISGKLQFVLLMICKKLLKSLKRRWKNNDYICVL